MVYVQVAKRASTDQAMGSYPRGSAKIVCENFRFRGTSVPAMLARKRGQQPVKSAGHLERPGEAQGRGPEPGPGSDGRLPWAMPKMASSGRRAQETILGPDGRCEKV